MTFQAKLSSCASIPSEFRLINVQRPVMVGCGNVDGKDGYEEMQELFEAGPAGQTPICQHIRSVIKDIERMAPMLRQKVGYETTCLLAHASYLMLSASQVNTTLNNLKQTLPSRHSSRPSLSCLLAPCLLLHQLSSIFYSSTATSVCHHSAHEKIFVRFNTDCHFYTLSHFPPIPASSPRKKKTDSH